VGETASGRVASNSASGRTESTGAGWMGNNSAGTDESPIPEFSGKLMRGAAWSAPCASLKVLTKPSKSKMGRRLAIIINLVSSNFPTGCTFGGAKFNREIPGMVRNVTAKKVLVVYRTRRCHRADGKTFRGRRGTGGGQLSTRHVAFCMLVSQLVYT
jgi:hypothetical protein